MSKEEIIARLSAQGRANLRDFVNEDGTVDLSRESAQQNMHLVREIRQRVSHGTKGTGDGSSDWETIETDIKLHDAQKAQELLGRAHGIFVDKIQVDMNMTEDAKIDTLINILVGARKPDTIDGEARDITPKEEAPE